MNTSDIVANETKIMRLKKYLKELATVKGNEITPKVIEWNKQGLKRLKEKRKYYEDTAEYIRTGLYSALRSEYNEAGHKTKYENEAIRACQMDLFSDSEGFNTV